MTTSRQRMATGGYGEAAAARHLVEQGMVVLDRNWRCEQGEIDLVLRDREVLVFCEVKTRASAAFGGPLESVTPTKVARLRRLGARWMQERGVRAPDVRLDLVGVLLDRGGETRLEHVRGVG
jgi:putative endonuclease